MQKTHDHKIIHASHEPALSHRAKTHLMKVADFAADALSPMSDRLIAGLDGLSVEQRCYRPEPDTPTQLRGSHGI